MLDNLENIAESIRTTLEVKHNAREATLTLARVLTRHCANAIRAMHRQEWDSALELLNTAQTTLKEMAAGVRDYPDLFYAGYTQDSFKEYAEARLTYAMVRNFPLPTPHEIGVEEATYLNGLCEAASELRRYILDILRHEHSDEAERLLKSMDSVYDVLVTFDFPDAISGGLRHRTDAFRAVLERTRGDMTSSVRQQRLEAALARAEGNQGEPLL